MFKKGIVLFAFISTLLVVSYIVIPVYEFYTKNIFSDGHSQPFVVKKNSSGWSVIKAMSAKKFIKRPLTVYYFNRLNGSFNNIKAGVYAIDTTDTPASLLTKIINGEVLQLPFALIAGKTWFDIKEEISGSKWLKPAHDVNPNVLGKYVNSTEGLFLADTYTYDAGSTALGMLKQANQALNDFLLKTWRTRASGLPYKTPYELLIAASIIEKETGAAKERAIIASVIVNRLQKRMRLQMDPTVIYALGPTWHGRLSKSDLEIASPYNTYKNLGLPPTPISMVSSQSLHAAANPLETNYLYFVSKGDGTHQFSANYKQQQFAVQRYLKRG